MNTIHLNTINTPRGATAYRQRGIALAVALVFLVVLTIIGITAMQTNVLEQRMAGNIQTSNNAFQAAESGIAKALRESTVTDATKTSSSPNTYSYTFGTGGNAETATVKAWYQAPGSNAPPGYSMGGPFMQHNFAVNSSVSGGAGHATHQQGFYIVGPSSSQ